MWYASEECRLEILTVIIILSVLTGTYIARVVRQLPLLHGFQTIRMGTSRSLPCSTSRHLCAGSCRSFYVREYN